MSLPFDLLSTDFDGTLFAEFENPPVPQALEEILERLQREGVRWVINTGRDMASLMECLGRARLRVHPDFIVTVEREIHSHDGHRYLPVNPWNDDCTRRHRSLFGSLRADLDEFSSWVETHFNATLYEDAWSPVCIVTENNADTDAIQERAEQLCSALPELAFVRNDVYARFSHADYNKGTALSEIARLLDLSAERIVAAGDHYNDLPMLDNRHAAWLIAPQNAIDPVRQKLAHHNGFISSRVAGNGLADGLNRLIETGSFD